MPLLEPKQLVQESQRAEHDDTIAAQVPYERMVNQPPPALLVPGDLLLGSLSDPRLRVVSPIRVRLFLEHDHVVAEAPNLNEFGYGSHISEAVRDIQRAIAQLYLSLEESSTRLGPDLVSTWSTLQCMIVRVRHA